MSARRARDVGSATLWVIVLGLLLSVPATVLVGLAQASAARHRAGAAADLAALAAAANALEPERACGRARSIATANGARLTSCTIDLDVADVVAEVALPAWLGSDRVARVRARAGQAQPDRAPAGGQPPVRGGWIEGAPVGGG